MINAVVLDAGEKVGDETREYGTRADWPGLPRHTLGSRAPECQSSMLVAGILEELLIDE